MKMQPIFLNLLLPIIKDLPFDSYELKINQWGIIDIYHSEHKLGFLNIDDFGNYFGQLENHQCYSRHNSFNKNDVFINHEKIYIENDCFDICTIYHKNEKISYMKNHYGRYKGVLGHKKFHTENNDFNNCVIKIF